MPDIKPIETFYNGYRFRSRLEARWAVFFDAAGIKYEYEPEGFTNDEDCYLPDFYFPEENMYGEVKGNVENYIKDLPKMVSMITDTSKIKKIMIFGNIPRTKAEIIFMPTLYYDVFDDNVSLCYKPIKKFTHSANILINWLPPEMSKCMHFLKSCSTIIDCMDMPMDPLTVEEIEKHINKTFQECGNQKSINGKEIKLIEMENYVGWYEENIGELLDKARQARFEHGERG